MSTATEPTLLCGYCQSETDARAHDLESTWQQWQCPHCSSWNDRELRPLSGREYEQQAEKALQHLQLALTYLKNAKAPRTIARVKLAISSAKGAVRAAHYRDQR